MRTKTYLWVASGMILLMGAIGCENGTKAPPAKSAAEATIDKNLAELSSADQQLARQQKICPVSGAALGSMPGVYKLEHDGRAVFLCCDGCKEKFESDPAGYLAKLPTAGAPGSQ